MSKSIIFTAEEISKIKKVKNATFVCDSTVKTRLGGWANTPVAIFYQENKHPASDSHYFGLYFDMTGKLLICNGQSAVDTPFVGVVAKDGEIIYSRYRHDYRVSQDRSVWVDGGRDYLRTSPEFPLVTLQIAKDQIKVGKYNEKDF